MTEVHGGGMEHGVPTGRYAGTHTVQEEADGRACSFHNTGIVTEGSPAQAPWRAEFVIHLDQPDPEKYYA